jgi:hypothetical protein
MLLAFGREVGDGKVMGVGGTSCVRLGLGMYMDAQLFAGVGVAGAVQFEMIDMHRDRMKQY